VATVAGSQTVKVTDIASGRTVHAQELGYDVVSLAFSPDGSRLATGGRNFDVTVWDAASGEVVHSLPVGPAGQVEAIAYSPDGTRLATDKIIWDAATGRQLFALLGHTQGISRFASTDGMSMITAARRNGEGVGSVRPRIFRLMRTRRCTMSPSAPTASCWPTGATTRHLVGCGVGPGGAHPGRAHRHRQQSPLVRRQLLATAGADGRGIGDAAQDKHYVPGRPRTTAAPCPWSGAWLTPRSARNAQPLPERRWRAAPWLRWAWTAR
jgi:hypothetical protein